MSAIAISYGKIQHLHLGYTYNIGFRGRTTHNYNQLVQDLPLLFCIEFLL